MGPVMCVVGARPNFMKMAPILRALAAHEPPLPALLVHTGQHYDQDMSDRLFVDLHLPLDPREPEDPETSGLGGAREARAPGLEKPSVDRGCAERLPDVRRKGGNERPGGRRTV